MSTGAQLISPTELVEVTPPSEGFAVAINNVEFVTRIDEEVGYVANVGTPNEVVSLDPNTLDGYSSNWRAIVREDSTSSFVQSPHDFELRWVSPGDSLYSPPRVFGFLRESIPVFAVNTTTNELADLLIEDRNDSGVFDEGDDLIITEQRGGSGTRRFRYRVSFSTDGAASSPPTAGNVLRIRVTRPFAEGDFFQFTLRPPTIDSDQAQNELERIAVVPNPYVGASEFEPFSQIEGRGERRVQFIHLPPQCTIKIFNIRGELIKTIEHNGTISDGSVFWDLQTEGLQDVAYGTYLFHVEAPGIGEHVGKFSLIK